MFKKNIIILLIVLCLIGTTVFLTKDYFFSPDNVLPTGKDWNPEKYLENGYSQEQINRLFAELERLSSRLEQLPNDYNTLLKAGNIYFMLGEYEQAESIFIQILEIEPSFAPAHANLGELYAGFLIDKNKALENYEKAIESNPWRSQYYRSLADLYWSDFPEKEKEIEPLMVRGAEKYPENKDFYTYLASYFAQKNNLVKAIQYLKLALKIDPDNETLKQELTELEGIYGQ